MSRKNIDITTKPIDFLGNELKVDDWIVYPTGGTSARMVLARIVRVEDIDAINAEREAEAEAKRATTDKWAYAHTVSIRDGFRGKARWRLVVNRQQEGTRGTGDKWWAVDPKKEVRVDQLHRVVKVPKP